MKQGNRGSTQKENVYTDKLREKHSEISIKDKKIRKARIHDHSKFSKSPLSTSRADRSYNLRRNESPGLNSSRSSKKMETRTISSERFKKIGKFKIKSPGLNSSRR